MFLVITKVWNWIKDGLSMHLNIWSNNRYLWNICTSIRRHLYWKCIRVLPDPNQTCACLSHACITRAQPDVCLPQPCVYYPSPTRRVLASAVCDDAKHFFPAVIYVEKSVNSAFKCQLNNQTKQRPCWGIHLC